MKSLFCLCSHLKSARRFIDLLRPLTLTVRPFKLKAMIGEKSSRIAIQSKCKFDSFFPLDLKYWGSKVWQKTVHSKVFGRICIRLKIIKSGEKGGLSSAMKLDAFTRILSTTFTKKRKVK